MALLSDFYKFYNTADADAVAADIKAGKVAFGPDGKITGAQSLAGDGTILFWNIGAGTSGAYVPNIADADYANDSCSVLLNNINWSRDGSGYLYPTGAGGGWSQLVLDAPAKSGVFRSIRAQYLVWDAAMPTLTRLPVIFNYQDAGNLWYVRWHYVDGTFNLNILKRVAGSISSVASALFPASIDPPCSITLTVDDYGDLVVVSCSIVEESISGIGNADVESLIYFETDRPVKSGTGFGFGELSGVNWGGISNIHIRDNPEHL